MTPLSRRRLLQLGLAAGAWAASSRLAGAASAGAPPDGARSLRFHALHTGERLEAVWWERGAFVPDALAAIDRVLRDHRTGEVAPIDPRLLHVLGDLEAALGTRAEYEVISGYRSPATNALLAAQHDGVSKRSLHVSGRAIDVNVPGRDLSRVREAALALQAGGVGYYPASGFVHVDTGRVRWW